MKNVKVKWKLPIIQSGAIEVCQSCTVQTEVQQGLENLQGFFVHRLLVYSVSSAPFIIHISAVYRAGVTAITGITSMLDRSQALPSEETVCVCVCVCVCVAV